MCWSPRHQPAGMLNQVRLWLSGTLRVPSCLVLFQLWAPPALTASLAGRAGSVWAQLCSSRHRGYQLLHAVQGLAGLLKSAPEEAAVLTWYTLNLFCSSGGELLVITERVHKHRNPERGFDSCFKKILIPSFCFLNSNQGWNCNIFFWETQKWIPLC